MKRLRTKFEAHFEAWLDQLQSLALREAEHVIVIDRSADFWRECYVDGMAPYQAFQVHTIKHFRNLWNGGIMTDNTKTAVERARDLAVPIMTEARRLRESNDLQWASWHAAIVEGIRQAITDTENRVRQESKALVAAAYLDALWAVDEAHRRNISGENWHERVRNFVASRSSADAQAALDQHVAAAVRPIENALERHRTLLASGVTKIRKAVAGREWLMEGRGSYGWDDDNWHKEFSAAAKEILDALEPLGREATRFDNCPNVAAKGKRTDA